MCVTLCLALAENMLVYIGREVFFWVCYFVTLAHLVAHSVSRGEVIEVDTVNVFKRNFLSFFSSSCGKNIQTRSIMDLYIWP